MISPYEDDGREDDDIGWLIGGVLMALLYVYLGYDWCRRQIARAYGYLPS